MTGAFRLTTEDICRHESKCECREWMYVTVPDYKTYHQASSWLRDERKYKLISVDGVFNNGYHTGQFKFKFLCEIEFVLFALKWS